MSVVEIKALNGSGKIYRFVSSVMTVEVVEVSGGITQKINLGYATSKVLELLISRTGTLVEREEIAFYAWDKRITTQNNINQSIKTLRLALDDNLEKSIIKTIPGRGFVFNESYLTDVAAVQKSLQKNATDSGHVSYLAPRSGEESPPLVFLWPDLRRIPRRHYGRAALYVLLLSQLALLGGLYDWPLFTSDAVSITEKKGPNTFVYLGGDRGKARALQGELEPLLAVAGMANPTVFVINRTHDFYEIGCLASSGRAGVLYIHASKLKPTLAQGLDKCFL